MRRGLASRRQRLSSPLSFPQIVPDSYTFGQMKISGYDIDVFGDTDPRKMPTHTVLGCVRIDYDSAERADIAKQDFSVCPRHWYVDATFRCEECGCEFVFSAREQQFWYEERRFYVDSQPRRCARRKRIEELSY